MIHYKTDWLFNSVGQTQVIYDKENLVVIVSDIADYHSVKKLHRAREMYELIAKLETLQKAGEPVNEAILAMQQLKQEIDN